MRTYAWGVCEAMNPQHSDTAALNALLFALGPPALKAATEQRYLALRSRCLRRVAATREAQVRRPIPPFARELHGHCTSEHIGAWAQQSHQQRIVAGGSLPIPMLQ